MSQAGSFSSGSISTPVSVANGGTGQATLTAHGLLIGEGTSPVNSLVLTANQIPIGVVSADPVGLTAPTIAGQDLIYDGGSVTWIAPYQDIIMIDEFNSAASGSDTGWVNANGGGGTFVKASSLATSAHPGVWEMAQNAHFANSGSGTAASLYVGGGAILIDLVCKVTPLSSGATNRYTATLGMCDTIDGVNANLIGFIYSDNINGGKWQLNCISASTATQVDSGIVVDTNWHRFSISINAGGTSVSFFIDGSSVGSAITTNIPSVGLGLVALNNNNAFTSGSASVAIDFSRFFQKLTASR